MVVPPDGVVDAVFLPALEDDLVVVLSSLLYDDGGGFLLSGEVGLLDGGGHDLHLLEEFRMGLFVLLESFELGLLFLLGVVACSLFDSPHWAFWLLLVAFLFLVGLARFECLHKHLNHLIFGCFCLGVAAEFDDFHSVRWGVVEEFIEGLPLESGAVLVLIIEVAVDLLVE